MIESMVTGSQKSTMSSQPGTWEVKGYTLIELMVIVTILAILSSIAVPAYKGYVLESRRSDARAALEEIRNLQYEFFQNYKQFGTRTQLGYRLTTENGSYQIAVTAGTLRYSASATAIGKQLADEDCRIFSYTSVGAQVAFDASNNPSTDCW